MPQLNPTRVLPGDRVELLEPLNDVWTRVRPGERGTVSHVDAIGTVHVKWDSGAVLGLVPEMDRYELVETIRCPTR